MKQTLAATQERVRQLEGDLTAAEVELQEVRDAGKQQVPPSLLALL
jgi:hypothetical protein